MMCSGRSGNINPNHLLFVNSYSVLQSQCHPNKRLIFPVGCPCYLRSIRTFRCSTSINISFARVQTQIKPPRNRHGLPRSSLFFSCPQYVDLEPSMRRAPSYRHPDTSQRLIFSHDISFVKGLILNRQGYNQGYTHKTR